jgi:hypothetical protein
MHAATFKVENSAQGLSCQLKFVNDQRYLREVDCSRPIISLQTIHFNKTRALVAGTNKAGGLAWQVGWVNRCAHFDCNILLWPIRELTCTIRQSVRTIYQAI